VSNAPERPGTANFLRALKVERNAKAGFAIGVAFSLLVFVRFVLLPGREYPLALWLALAFVLAVGTGLLLTVVFTLGSAYRLARRVDEDDL
jgi:hypothetical protein